jgi:hypothetical protein
MALAVAAGRQRVDRHHLVARRGQGADQEPTIQLDADDHLGRLGGMVSDQPMQRPDTGHPVRDPPAAEHRAGLVQDAHLVVGLGPAHADKDQPDPLSWSPVPAPGRPAAT